MFRFPSHDKEIPEDYFPDEETGLRPKEKVKAAGVTKTFIDKGIPTHTILPPIEVWERGTWFVLMNDDQQKALANIVGSDSWESWIVNGEGTPGNFLARIYVVNSDAAADVECDHPLNWPEKHKKPPGSTTTMGFSQPTGGGYSGGGYTGYGGSPTYATGQSSTKPSTPKPVSAPALPAGIRFRCECGHWFKEAGLAPHRSHCCPAKEESREADWAILCECCLTLDQVAACKPGFPRPKKEKEVVPDEKTEVKKDAAKATAEVVQ